MTTLSARTSTTHPGSRVPSASMIALARWWHRFEKVRFSAQVEDVLLGTGDTECGKDL